MRLFGEDTIVVPITIDGVPRPAAPMAGMSRLRPRGALLAVGVAEREKGMVRARFAPAAPVPLPPPGVGRARG